jgi:ribosomal protein S18 acetylase RimI-like enzyme
MNVGRMLYDHVREYAESEGFYNITLNVWTCNQGAMKFYETLGFVPQKIGMEIIM